MLTKRRKFMGQEKVAMPRALGAAVGLALAAFGLSCAVAAQDENGDATTLSPASLARVLEIVTAQITPEEAAQKPTARIVRGGEKLTATMDGKTYDAVAIKSFTVFVRPGDPIHLPAFVLRLDSDWALPDVTVPSGRYLQHAGDACRILREEPVAGARRATKKEEEPREEATEANPRAVRAEAALLSPNQDNIKSWERLWNRYIQIKVAHEVYDTPFSGRSVRTTAISVANRSPCVIEVIPEFGPREEGSRSSGAPETGQRVEPGKTIVLGDRSAGRLRSPSGSKNQPVLAVVSGPLVTVRVLPTHTNLQPIKVLVGVESGMDDKKVLFWDFNYRVTVGAETKQEGEK